MHPSYLSSAICEIFHIPEFDIKSMCKFIPHSNILYAIEIEKLQFSAFPMDNSIQSNKLQVFHINSTFMAF